MRNYEDLIPDSPKELDILEQEDQCRKVLRTVGKAVFIRLFVAGILILAMFTTSMEIWVVGLMVFALVINLTGMLPLILEWRKQLGILKEILAQDDE